MPDPDDSVYRENLQTVRERIRGFLLVRRHDANDADDVTQDCVVALLQGYPHVRDRADMLRLATRIASNRICQVYRDRARLVRFPEGEGHEPAAAGNPEETAQRRELVDRVLLGMMELQTRCRDLLRMLLIEQKDYSEIRVILGMESDYFYVVRERCFQALKRNVGGSFYGTG
jgi:RNA polymerase sigma factor (sigma-70 family)